MPPGEPWDAARRYASPIEHVAAGNRPLLILHSDDDPSIPVQQAIDMAAAMEHAGAPHEFVHYTDRGHMPIEGEVIKRSREFIDKVQAHAR